MNLIKLLEKKGFAFQLKKFIVYSLSISLAFIGFPLEKVIAQVTQEVYEVRFWPGGPQGGPRGYDPGSEFVVKAIPYDKDGHAIDPDSPACGGISFLPSNSVTGHEIRSFIKLSDRGDARVITGEGFGVESKGQFMAYCNNRPSIKAHKLISAKGPESWDYSSKREPTVEAGATGAAGTRTSTSGAATPILLGAAAGLLLVAAVAGSSKTSSSSSSGSSSSSSSSGSSCTSPTWNCENKFCCNPGAGCCSYRGITYGCCPSGYPLYCPSTNSCYKVAGSSPCGISGEVLCYGQGGDTSFNTPLKQNEKIFDGGSSSSHDSVPAYRYEQK